MIFRSLGQFVSHQWKLVLVLWGLVSASLIWTAPDWNQIIREGEFRSLPASAPSQVAEAVYRDAFSYDLLQSTAVIVVRRAGSAEGLLPQDREFIDRVLKPAIRRIDPEERVRTSSSPDNLEGGEIIRGIRTASDSAFGRLLISNEKNPKTTLVLVEFATKFPNRENWFVLKKIETLIAQEGELLREPENLFVKKLIPPGLDLSLSGPAIVGRDLGRHAETSMSSILQWAMLIGIAGLLIFYRAPLLALAVIVNAAAAVSLSEAALAHLANWGALEVFGGLDNYGLIVIAGVSVMMGMMFVSGEVEARFHTPTLEDATADALKSTGPILSSGAVLMFVGWGILLFAEFGQFQQLGAALLIGAMFGILSTLTLVPALLALFGRFALWPNLRTERISADQPWSSPRDPWSRLLARGWSLEYWRSVFRAVQSRAIPILAGGGIALVALAALAVSFRENLTYGLLSQLPENEASVKGANMIQEQFPAGTTAPVTLLLKHEKLYFSSIKGKALIGELSDALEAKKSEFRIADVRSVTYPLGLSQKDVAMEFVITRSRRHRKAVKYFVADKPPIGHHATKLEIVFDDDPFSRQSIKHFEKLRRELPELLPPELADAEWHLLGASAAIRDLKIITDRDRKLIQALMIGGSFLCLALVFRRVGFSLVLVALAGGNYLAALGATYAVFWLGTDGEFEGLDWKVPTFLFAIQFVLSVFSYGMMLARVRQEQADHDASQSLLKMLQRDGSVLLGSGLLLAGLFASLLGGTLVGLKQLGFGLGAGALVDALVIRPWILPACFLLKHKSASVPEEQPPPRPGGIAPPPAPPRKESLKLTVPPDSDA